MTSPQPPSEHRLSSSQPISPRLSSSGNAVASRLSSPTASGSIRTRKSVDESAVSREAELTPPQKPSAKATPPMAPIAQLRRARMRSPWACSPTTLLATVSAILLAILILYSFLSLHVDPKGAAMSYMRPAFAKFPDFDTEHTRFASKYSLYLYREGGIDEDTRVKGIPVLFIPGNAGSYKQVRPIAAQAAVHYHESLRDLDESIRLGKRTLDFFSVDFNEDLTAFHGQTLLDQAEYLNEAIAYILSLYTNPHRSLRDSGLPDPTSVILLAHSMGGIVARTMLTMPNYQPSSVNTILTLAAPHARPPVSFDADIVSTYQRVNTFWRESYAKNETQNPLSNVATISIAGGGLDTMVPSDYATIASLVPPTHGFTVFTSTMPRVWTAMDHLAITWCDQLRHSIVRALYDVVDATRPNQTRPLQYRMDSFKRWFLTGMEPTASRNLIDGDPDTLLTIADSFESIKSQGERLVLRRLGDTRKAKAHLMSIPPVDSLDGKRFSLLTDQKLDSNKLLVLFCSVFPLQSGPSTRTFSVDLDLAGTSSGSMKLACKNAASDAIALPASTTHSEYPFDEAEPFSYLQYDLEQLADHQFVAVIDKAADLTPGWVVAEFSSKDSSTIAVKEGLRGLISSDLDLKLPSKRPMMTEVKIPSVHSSLMTYKVHVRQSGVKNDVLFAPLLRQYISDPFESKFFVNVHDADISLHGVAPYMPPSLQGHVANDGLTLQFWSDPSSDDGMSITLSVDLFGSMGKLWMRYRTVFAAFPLLVVALVLRKQFQLYDTTGVFISFTESMELCLRRSVPALLLAITFLAVAFSRTSQTLLQSSDKLLGLGDGSVQQAIDFTINDLILGSQDPFFWFLIPLFGLITIGICILGNYAVLSLTHFCSLVYAGTHRLIYKDQRINGIFTDTSLQKRLIVTTVLLVLVSTVIPYQFVFVVLCMVQLATCVRALTLARETHSGDHMNLNNYTHSIVQLMLWILPINVPILVVWIRNLAVQWLTPFSSHHNILSILPFVLLVQTQSTGKMVPRVRTGIVHQLTNIMLFCLAVYAAVYGVTFAYLLHWLVNIVCAWLMLLHASAGALPGPLVRLGNLAGVSPGHNGVSGMGGASMNGVNERKSTKKRP